ncbi:MAG: sigma-54-dependent transcriptional regulator [Acidobacteriota bacterium]
MERRDTILIVDDEEPIRKQLSWALRDKYRVLLAADGAAALRSLREESVDLVLLDLRFPPHLDDICSGREILEEMHSLRPSLPILVMTADQDRDTAVEMVARGALDLFRKPIDLNELHIILKRSLRIRRLEHEVGELRSRLQATHGLEGMIGKSPPIREVARLVRKVADTHAAVLILGESGTGKELVARALHQLSSRREGPFVALNCGAVPAGLLDDDLFGHEKGAFTGAAGRRVGKFEYASGGTLFLDEVGDLPDAVQTKLLRVLQESEIQRLGGNETIPVEVRLVTATHQDLEARIETGTFREDIYYRLKVVTIRVPPLRERPGDLALLLEHFLEKHGSASSPRSFSNRAVELLELYHWPGNVRELKNLVNSLCVTCDGPVIDAGDLPAELTDMVAAAGRHPEGNEPGSMNLLAHEKGLIRRALEQTGGNRSQAARLLGISRHVLLGKIRKHRL